MKCKNCIFLEDYWCEEVAYSPDEETERECAHFKQKTNGDRIRAMSDEQLAEWHEECPYITQECSMIGCVRCVLEWLKQPAEEE